MVMKEVSSAHQACIHMIKKYSKICNDVKYYHYLKQLFSIWIYVQM